jgi:hypothetical protein
MLENYAAGLAVIQDDQRDFESKYLNRVSQIRSEIESNKLSNSRTNTLRQTTEEAFAEAEKLETEWTSKMEELAIRKKSSFFYRRYWGALNGRVRIPQGLQQARAVYIFRSSRRGISAMLNRAGGGAYDLSVL